MTFKWVSVFLLITACAFSHARAVLPNVSESDFKGHEGVLLINSDDKKYLAILARKKILIDQIQYKNQKILTLKSKKILLDYFRKKQGMKINIVLNNMLPTKYWQSDDYAYLISIVNKENIKIFPHNTEQIKKLMNDTISIQAETGAINVQ